MPLEVPYNLSVRRALLNLQSGTVFHLIENPHSSTQGQCTMLQRFFLNLSVSIGTCSIMQPGTVLFRRAYTGAMDSAVVYKGKSRKDMLLTDLPADSIIPLEIPYYCNSLDHFTHRNGTSQMQSI